MKSAIETETLTGNDSDKQPVARLEHGLTAICALGMVVLTVLLFAKVLFAGQSISRLDILNRVDALVNPSLTQAFVQLPRDPSGVQLFFPVGHYIERMLRTGNLPLWNPLNAMGFPLVGDVQSRLLAPYHLFAAFSSVRSYDLFLIANFCSNALCTFACSRLLGLSRTASLLAATAFAMSPLMVESLDLATTEMFAPLALTFVWLSKCPSLLRASLAGLVCALCLYVMHPEPSLFATGFGALLCVCLPVAAANPSERSGSDQSPPLSVVPLVRRLMHALQPIVVAAAVAFMVAAPLLFPFFTFFLNASFYKDSSTVVHLPSLVDFVSHTAFGSAIHSPFTGAVALILMPLAAWRPHRTTRALLCTLAIAAVICFPCGPLAHVFSTRPFSYLAVDYGIPFLLMLLTVLAGIGLDNICSFNGTDSRALQTAFFAGGLVLAIGAFAQALAPLNAQTIALGGLPIIFEVLRLHQVLLKTVSLASLGAMILVVAAPFWRRLNTTALPLLLLTINLLSLVPTAQKTVAAKPMMSMQPPAIVEFLQQHPGRFTAAGENFFLPVTNLLFGVEDCRNFNPLNPKRYNEFFKSHNLGLNGSFFLHLPEELDHLVDLGSIKYVATRDTITSVDDNASMPGCVPLLPVSKGKVGFALRLKQSSIYYDCTNAQVSGYLILKAQAGTSMRYAIQFALFDRAGKCLWLGAQRWIASSPDHHHLSTVPVHIPLNRRLPEGSLCRPAFRVVDTYTGLTIGPGGKDVVALKEGYVVVADLITQKPPESAARHFQLAAETADGMRVYENKQSLPPAYMIFRPLFVKDGDEALQHLSKLDFDPSRQAIVETPAAQAAAGTSPAAPVPSTATVAMRRPNPNAVSISVDTAQKGFLILTDSLYPGWNAYLDGRKTEILPGNYLFRAVSIPQGRHLVEFRFMPVEFLCGLLLSAAALLCVAGIAVASFCRAGKRRSA